MAGRDQLVVVEGAQWSSFGDGTTGPEFKITEDESVNWNLMWKSRTFSLVKDFRRCEVYRAAAIELITSGCYVFLSLATVITSLQSHFESNLAAIALIHVLLIAFFISSALPASGGHFNPVLTFTSFLTGHTSFPRAFLYISGQAVGSILGALAIKSVLDPAVAREFSLGGCLLRQDIDVNGVSTLSGVDNQQGFVSELIFTFVYLHINYAMGLDPKQAPIYGPVLGPAFCGILVGMTIFVSGNLQPGYGGAGFNPARCLGPVASFSSEQPKLREQYWVFLIAPATACVMEAIVYHLLPFDHSTLYKKRASSIHVALRVLSHRETGSTRSSQSHRKRNTHVVEES